MFYYVLFKFMLIFKDQSQLAFSTSQLKTLQFLHLTPINRVIFPWPNGEYSS